MPRPAIPRIDSVWHDNNTNTEWRVQSFYKNKSDAWCICLQSTYDSKIRRKFPHEEFASKNFTEAV